MGPLSGAKGEGGKRKGGLVVERGLEGSKGRVLGLDRED